MGSSSGTGKTGSVNTMAAGFADSVMDSQRLFRSCLEALSRPGKIQSLPVDLRPPPPLLPPAAAIVLALVDFETQLWLDSALTANPDVSEFLRFHTGAKLTSDPGTADFAVVSAPSQMPPLSAFDQGTPAYPDRASTIILQVETVTNAGWVFTGPGIETRVQFNAAPLPENFTHQWRANHQQFPCGVDLMFVTHTQLAALPRSAVLDISSQQLKGAD